jgi:four helix bundle protein
VRAGTAAGANYEEARGAESRADFVHKLGIAWKETRESWYWLRLIQRAELVSPQLLASIVDEANQLSAILASSIATARKRS